MSETTETAPVFDVAAARAICDRATPGPWTREKPERGEDGFSKGVGIAGTPCKQMVYANPPGGQFPSADCNFIAAARTLLPAALDEIERLRKERDDLDIEAARLTALVDYYVKAFRLSANYKPSRTEASAR